MTTPLGTDFQKDVATDLPDPGHQIMEDNEIVAIAQVENNSYMRRVIRKGLRLIAHLITSF